MGGSCGTYAGEEGAYRVLVRKIVGKRTLGRSRRKREGNIKMYL
jgi:hypothetical protein